MEADLLPERSPVLWSFRDTYIAWHGVKVDAERKLARPRWKNSGN